MASETEICNQALGRLGAKRLNSLTDDTSAEAIHCRLHYAQTRDALMQSHNWRFTVGRSVLSADTETPAFEWNFQYVLPDDYLRQLGLYDTENSFIVEGDRLLTNDDEANLVYIRNITDPAKFSPLYIEVLVLKLAIKLVMPIAQDKTLRRELQDEVAGVFAEAKMISKTEGNSVGRNDLNTWLNARLVRTI